MKINRRKIYFWLKVIVIIYCSIGTALYYLQDKLLFHPEKLPADYKFSFKQSFKEVQIPVNKTDTISIIQFYPQDSVRKGLIVYYHGNLKNVLHYATSVSFFTDRGYEVWMPEYPGYGKSTGERNEKKLYDQAWLIQKMAMSKYRGDSIIIYGRSLGTGIAAYAASVSECRQLVLETPYYSMTDLFSHYAFMYPTSLMGKYKIPTWEFIQDVKAPVIIFHGTSDKIIPYSCAEKLITGLKKRDKFIRIEKGHHNNLPEFEVYKHVMDSVLR